MLRTRKFPGLLEQFTSQQFQFTKSNQNQYNSIHIHHSNIQRIHSLCIIFKIEAQKKKKNSPKRSIMLYRRQNLNKFKKSILPLFVSFVDWKFDCRCSSFAHSYCPTKLKKKNLLTLQAIMNKLHKVIKNFNTKSIRGKLKTK